MERIYCISGMGADGRIFRNLTVAGVEFVPVPWLPYQATDTIQSYAARMSSSIPGDNPTILGLSYGGMLAVEIGKIRPAKKIFLISSAKGIAELPQYGPMVQTVLRQGIIPTWCFTFPNPLNYIIAGGRSIDDISLLGAMAAASDGGFIKWALKSLLTWNNTTHHTPNIVQVHGSADLIIPGKNVTPNYWITGGTHVLVYNRADEVSRIVAENME